MLNNPARNAKATASPVKIYGVTCRTVSPKKYTSPNAPFHKAAYPVIGLSPYISIITPPANNPINTDIIGIKMLNKRLVNIIPHPQTLVHYQPLGVVVLVQFFLLGLHL